MFSYTQPSTLEAVLLFALALLPALILMILIYRMDKKEKEPVSLLLKLLLVGVMCALPAMLLETIADLLLAAVPSITVTVYCVLSAVLVAVIEEGCKFLAVHHYTWCDPEFNYRFDGVVYAVFVSLGFAAIENIFYVQTMGLVTALLRAILAVPAHFAFAVYMGSCYGSAKEAEVRGNMPLARHELFAGYITAVIFHALYDGMLMVDTDWTFIAFIVMVIVMYVATIIKIRRSAKADASVFE